MGWYMKMEIKDKESTEKMVEQVMKSLQQIAEELREDPSIPIDKKLPQMDVLLHTMHFLMDIETNVNVLREYWRTKH